MDDTARLRRVRELMDGIVGEASAFVEFNPQTDDAFQRIRLLARQARAVTVPYAVVSPEAPI